MDPRMHGINTTSALRRTVNWLVIAKNNMAARLAIMRRGGINEYNRASLLQRYDI